MRRLLTATPLTVPLRGPGAPAGSPPDGMIVLGVVAAAALAVVVAGDLLRLYEVPEPIPSGPRLWLGAPGLALAAAAVMRVGGLRRATLAFAMCAGVVGAAAYGARELDSGSTAFATTLPIVVLAGVAFARRPIAGMAIMLALTGFYGTLSAYTEVPYLRIIYAVLLALTGAALARHLFAERRDAIVVIPATALIAAYLLCSTFQAVAAPNLSAAMFTLRIDHAFMGVVLLIAYAGWAAASRLALARVIAVLALAVGGYATLRWFIGPSDAERALASSSAFNFVEGVLKLSGSLPSGFNLGAWTGVAVPICVALALAWRGGWRLVAVLAAATCAFAVSGSGARSGVLGAGLGVLVVLALFAMTRAFAGGRIGGVAVAAAVATIAAIATIGYTGIDSSDSHRLTAVFSSEDTSHRNRVYKWRLAFRDLRDKPFGYGIGTGTTAYGGAEGRPQATAVGRTSVDSGYIKIALEQGTWMALFFIAALLATLGGLVKNAAAARRRDDAALAVAAAGALASFAFLLFAGAFQEGVPALLAWVAIGLGLAPFVRPGHTDPADD